MSPNNAYKLLLGLVGVVILGSLISVYLTDQYLAGRSARISDLKADDEILTQRLLSAQTTEANLDELVFVNELADEVLPDAKNQSEVILLINKIADEVGVRTDSFNFASTEGDPDDLSQTKPLAGATGILVLPITTSIRATYDQLIEFLEKTELNKRKMQISEIAISPLFNDDGYPTGALDVMLTINAYVKAGS